MTAYYIGLKESTLGPAGNWKEILKQKTGDAAGPGEMRDHDDIGSGDAADVLKQRGLVH